jgi:hypothetical protein
MSSGTLWVVPFMDVLVPSIKGQEVLSFYTPISIQRIPEECLDPGIEHARATSPTLTHLLLFLTLRLSLFHAVENQ